MFSNIFRISLLATLLTAAGIWFSRPVTAQDYSFDGTWEGRLELVDATEAVDGTPRKLKADDYEKAKAYWSAPLKITIRGQKATVYMGADEIVPGLFQAHVHKTNALVFASHSGGRWVETQSYVLTQKNHDALLVVFSRAVNNRDVAGQPPGEKIKILMAAVGEVYRRSQ